MSQAANSIFIYTSFRFRLSHAGIRVNLNRELTGAQCFNSSEESCIETCHFFSFSRLNTAQHDETRKHGTMAERLKTIKLIQT